MKKLLFILLIPSLSWGSGIFNPGSGSGSGTPSGSSGNIQYNNSGSFGGASFFNVHSSSASSTADTLWTSNSIGPVLTDANNCLWRTTVNISGALETTLLTCPVVMAARPCSPGQSLGLLLSITCSETLGF